MRLYNSDGKKIKYSLPNVVLMGDSITDNWDDHGWWVDIIADYVEFESLKNYAVGYARWTLASDTVEDLTTHSHVAASWNVIWNQVNRLKNDVTNGVIGVPDVIVILAGTNDVTLNQPMGSVETAFDGADILNKPFSDIGNMAQSIRYTCEYIKSLYPDTQVILATPLQRMDKSESAWECIDIIMDCAKNLSLKVIDQMGEAGIYGYSESVSEYHLSDNVHPTTGKGSRLIARFLAKEFVQKII
jgi:lysophospholipase L1-like esterase